jgi:hypothetical protein
MWFECEVSNADASEIIQSKVQNEDCGIKHLELYLTNIDKSDIYNFNSKIRC